jgi:hypothetical protein
VTNVGNPSYVYGPYVGPAGSGANFAPGFDPDNYLFVIGGDPRANQFFRPDVSSPEAEEWTLSFGYRLARNGWLKLTYVNRDFENFVEDFIDLENGTTVIQPEGVVLPLEVTNRIYDNSDVPVREYEGLVFQGRYNIIDRWFVEGHWTYQMQNHGNYEGESGQGFGPSSFEDYTPLLDQRNFPFGRLDDFQRDKVRLWTVYSQPLGRAGDISFSLLGNYDTGTAYSLTEALAPTAVQLALDPGYPDLFGSATTFFGPRGVAEFDDYWSADFAVLYALPIWKRIELFIKGEVYNITNEDTLVAFDTDIRVDPASSLDSLGRPTGFIQQPNFGKAVSNSSFVTPLEYRASVGFRF